MATEYYPRTSYIGGIAGSLDDIPCATLGDGDIAVVANATVFTVHYYDSTSAAAESSPDVVKPDDNAGNGRWLIIRPNTVVPDAGTVGSESYEGAIAITSAGVLTFSGQSGCGVQLSANQEIPSATYIKLAFVTENWDTQNEFDNTYVVGAADATEANKLHDNDGGFLASMVGATVWNTTDNTYTTVSGFVDNGELDLTDDIMVNGEGYVIYWARYTASTAGKYAASATGQIATLADGDRIAVGFQKNGSFHSNRSMFKTGGAGTCAIAGLAIFDLAINDYIEVFVMHENAAVRTASLGDYRNAFQIQKIG